MVEEELKLLGGDNMVKLLVLLLSFLLWYWCLGMYSSSVLMGGKTNRSAPRLTKKRKS